jgi:hypothetical protein
VRESFPHVNAVKRAGEGMRVNRMWPSRRCSVKEGAALLTLTDAQIISASNADHDRFGEIFDRHFPAIHRYLHRRVGRALGESSVVTEAGTMGLPVGTVLSSTVYLSSGVVDSTHDTL